MQLNTLCVVVVSLLGEGILEGGKPQRKGGWGPAPAGKCRPAAGLTLLCLLELHFQFFLELLKQAIEEFENELRLDPESLFALRAGDPEIEFGSLLLHSALSFLPPR